MKPLDPAEWIRRGRGHTLQFFATDDDMRRYLRGLPEALGPYTVVGTRLERDGRFYHPIPFTDSLQAWLDAPFAHWQFWIWSRALVPPFPLIGDRFNERCGVNGLIAVDHGSTRDGKRFASMIGITARIEHVGTGEVRTLDAQLGLFRKLRSSIQKDLRYTSIHVYKDGHAEESRLQMMTPAAAELAPTGYFINDVGSRVR